MWSFRALDGIGDAPFLGGINSLLFPWPGEIKRASNAPKELIVSALASPVHQSVWGNHTYDEFISQSMFGTQMRTPERYVPRSGERPSVAVKIAGKMRRAYGPDQPAEDDQKDKSS